MNKTKLHKVAFILLPILIISIFSLNIKLKKDSSLCNNSIIKISTVNAMRSAISDDTVFKEVLEKVTESDNNIINLYTLDNINKIFSITEKNTRDLELNKFIESELKYFNTLNTIIDLLNIIVDSSIMLLVVLICLLVEKRYKKKVEDENVKETIK